MKKEKYNPEFVEKVLKNSKEKANIKFKDPESFLKQIEGESLDDYENPDEIKKAYPKAVLEYFFKK